MGFTLKIEGSGELLFGEDIVQLVQASVSSPNTSKAKAAETYGTMWITGSLHGDDEQSGNSDTIELFHWAQVPAEQAEAYRNVTVCVNANSKCYRQIKFTKGFVVDYEEKYSATAGVGTFSLILRQKADKFDEIEVTGGMPLAEEMEMPDAPQEAGGGNPLAAAGQTAPQSAGRSAALREMGQAAAQAALSGAGPEGMAGAFMEGGVRGAAAGAAAAIAAAGARKLIGGAQGAASDMKTAASEALQRQAEGIARRTDGLKI